MFTINHDHTNFKYKPFATHINRLKHSVSLFPVLYIAFAFAMTLETFTAPATLNCLNSCSFVLIYVR